MARARAPARSTPDRVQPRRPGVASEASLAGLGGNERPPGVEAPVPPTRHARRPAGLALEPSLGRGGLQATLEALVPPLGRMRRRRELEAAVPEALDVLRATVAAGVGPSRALQAAAESTSAPLGRLLDQARRLAELGGGAGQALAAVARSNDLAELALAGEALALAETTGAPPGPVLAGVAAAAADRVRARQARLAATAEARLSARVVAGMAPAFLLVLAATSPSDVAFLVREPLGWAALTAAAALEALGAWWASRIVRAVE